MDTRLLHTLYMPLYTEVSHSGGLQGHKDYSHPTSHGKGRLFSRMNALVHTPILFS